MRHPLLSATLALGVSLALPVGSALAQPPAPAPLPEPAKPTKTTAAAALDEKLGALFVGTGLTADVVAGKTAADSPEARAKHAEAQAADTDVDSVIYRNLPTIKLSASFTKLSPIPVASFGNFIAAPADAASGAHPKSLNDLTVVPFAFNFPFHQYTLDATAVVPVSDYILRSAQVVGAAKHSRASAQADEQAQRLKAAADGRLAYYAWVRAKLETVVAAQALEQSRLHLEDAKNRFAAGTASKADVLRVESQLAQSKLLVTRLEEAAVVDQERIRIATGDPQLAFNGIGEDMRSSPAPLNGLGTVEALYAEALDKRVELRVLDETKWSLKDRAHVARVGAFPRIDGVASATYANPNQRIFPPADKWDATWALGVQATWTLNDLGTGLSAARGLDAQAARVEAQKNQLANALKAEVAESLSQLRVAEASIESTAQGQAAAEEAYRVRRELFRNAQATSTELSDAETDLTRARLDAINARVDLRVARVRLLHAIGRDAPAAPPK